jgi:hypothetical protein
MQETKRTTNKTEYSRVILEDGFGFRKYGVDYNSAPSPTQLDDCKQWLLTYAKKTRRPDGKCLNSYYLKHVVERAVGHYISNGALIQAAIALGFEYSLIDGPNALFHIDLRLPEDDWKTCEAYRLFEISLQARPFAVGSALEDRSDLAQAGEKIHRFLALSRMRWGLWRDRR